MKNFTRLACFASMALAAFTAHAETYAVLVGICDYPDVADKAGNPIRDDKGEVINNDLSGCVNDIKTYQTLLTGKFGVKKDNVKVLLDKQADEKGFVENVKWLLNVAKPGDQVMFFYSGHGTQFESKDEADGKQEAIVLADMTLVDGSLFGSLSKALSKAGMHATFVFDSCFSGGMTRDAGKKYDDKPVDIRQRFLEPANFGTKAIEFTDKKENVLLGIPKKKGMAQGGSYAYVLAGAENQPTIDLDFKDEKTEDHGLFSLIFTGLLNDLPDAPIEDMVKAIEAFMVKKEFKQNPTFEFSSEARGQQPFFLKG